MRISLASILLLSVSVSWCQIGSQPISGELLKQLNTLTAYRTANVWYFDCTGLPHGIDELLMSCVEVLDDSLDIYLLGLTPETDIPLLLAISGYRGEYCFDNFNVRYHAEEDEFELKFYIPGCARICGGYFRWNIDDQSLIPLRCYVEDSALEALAKADSYLVEGHLHEAIDELSSIQHSHTSYYYDPDEMIARLLRFVDRSALEEANAGNYRQAVDLFNLLFEYNRMSYHWYHSFSDSLHYMESERASYMSLSEYVSILNNYAFYLEQTDDLFLSLRILVTVLDLQPSLIGAHLNIADVLWKLADYTEANDHYSIYAGMMTESGSADRIPPRVHGRQTAQHGVSDDSVMVNTLAESSCHIEAWDRIRIDRCHLLETGGITASADLYSPVYGIDEVSRSDPWTIAIGPDGRTASCEETSSDNSIILHSHRYGDYWDIIWLIALTDPGDTLWTCALEGTGEYSYPPEVTGLSDGGYMLLSRYDCWSSYAWIARISSSGELQWHNFLSSNYLMELWGGEVEPRVCSFRETSSGDILACGSASEWITDPKTAFVCLLDGETGDPIWKTIYLGLGQAVVYDAIETSSGMIVAVGSTAESVRPEDGSSLLLWGTRNPFIAVLDSDGEIRRLAVCDFDKAYELRSINETNPSTGEFLIAGSSEGDPVFLRMVIPTSPVEQGNQEE